MTSQPPIVYWRFESNILPDGHTLEAEVSTTGDECHYNIGGLTDRDAKNFFRDKLRDDGTLSDGEVFHCRGKEGDGCRCSDMRDLFADTRVNE